MTCRTCDGDYKGARSNCPACGMAHEDTRILTMAVTQPSPISWGRDGRPTETGWTAFGKIDGVDYRGYGPTKEEAGAQFLAKVKGRMARESFMSAPVLKRELEEAAHYKKETLAALSKALTVKFIGTPVLGGGQRHGHSEALRQHMGKWQGDVEPSPQPSCPDDLPRLSAEEASNVRHAILASGTAPFGAECTSLTDRERAAGREIETLARSRTDGGWRPEALRIMAQAYGILLSRPKHLPDENQPFSKRNGYVPEHGDARPAKREQVNALLHDGQGRTLLNKGKPVHFRRDGDEVHVAVAGEPVTTVPIKNGVTSFTVHDTLVIVSCP